MRTIIVATLALTLALALAGCTTDEEDAAAACGDNDRCQTNYLARAHAREDAEEAAVLGAMLTRPVHTTCMNIGGIVTCQ